MSKQGIHRDSKSPFYSVSLKKEYHATPKKKGFLIESCERGTSNLTKNAVNLSRAFKQIFGKLLASARKLEICMCMRNNIFDFLLSFRAPPGNAEIPSSPEAQSSLAYYVHAGTPACIRVKTWISDNGGRKIKDFLFPRARGKETSVFASEWEKAKNVSESQEFACV